MNKYAYLGDTSFEVAREITNAFPNVEIINVGVGLEGNVFCELGVPNSLSVEAIGMYQMVAMLWGNKELQREVGDIIVEGVK